MLTLVRPVRDPQRPQVRPHVRQRGILTDAHGAVDLHRAVNDLQRHGRHFDLGLGNLLQRVLGVFLVDLDRRVQHDQARGVDLDACARDPFEQDAVFAERFAKGDLAVVVESVDHVFESAFGGAEGAHGVVDAAGTQTALHDLVPSSLAQNEPVKRDFDVREGDVAVAVGRVIVAVHGQHAVDFYPGRVAWDQHHGLLHVFVWMVWVGLAHDDEDLTSVVAGAAGPPFRAVEEIVVSMLFHAELDVGPVGRGDVGFGHKEAGADFASEEGPEPFVFLGGRAVCCVFGSARGKPSRLQGRGTYSGQ